MYHCIYVEGSIKNPPLRRKVVRQLLVGAGGGLARDQSEEVNIAGSAVRGDQGCGSSDAVTRDRNR